MSGYQREKTILEQVESAELLLQKLKEKVISDNGNDVAVVNAIYNEGSLLSKQIEDLLHDTAPQKADEVFSALISFLDDNYDDMPRDTLWDTFHDKLKLFEGTCLEFRKECLTRDTASFRGNDNWNIFHVVCRLNPPVDIIKTLIDITPPENPCHYFNHLACTPSPDDDHMYPLDVVGKCGGTLDVVKLLVDIDKEKNALKFEKGTSARHVGKSAIHVLIKHRKKHHPKVFSEILRYLVLSIDDFGRSALKQSAMPKCDWALPVSQLWYNMILKEKKSRHEIIQNNDFIFLLKATCYHHLFACIRRWTCNDMTKLNESERARQIEDMSLSNAFTICLHCFTARYDTTGDTLRDLLSSDSKFLEDRDERGNYPIHNMIIDSSYFWGSAGSRDNLFLIPSILEAVPKCARQLDNEGRLPLHIAANLQNLMPHGMREKLVRAIWKAYPKAATVPDKKTGLLPFALAARNSNEGYDFNTVLDSRLENDDSLTSSFFLLRQYPEIISEYNVLSGSEDKAPKLPAKRKHEEHCNSE